MRFDAFYIEGFGIYHRQGVANLPDGLVLFTGENESGKTTLMEFFRFVLFGPERKSGERNDYQPLAGGAPGGRLTLVRQDGRRLVVERVGKRVSLSQDGVPVVQAEPAVAVLGGVDRNTYKAVFAVGLKDLQGLGLLNQEGVGGRLFAAGAGTGAAALPAALKRLDEHMAELLQVRGKGKLNQALERLRQIHRELGDLEKEAGRFAELQRQQDETEQRLEAERAQTQQWKVRLARLKQLAKAREPWVSGLAARQRLEELADAAKFPPHGLVRREHLRQAAEAIRKEVAEQHGEVLRRTAELSALHPDALLLAQRSHLEALLAEEKRLTEALAREPEERLALQQADQEVHRRLRELGPDWDEDRLAQVDTSMAVRHEVQEFDRRLKQAERRLEECQARERNLVETKDLAQRQLETLRGKLSAAPAPPGDSPERWVRERAGLRRAGVLLARREVLAAKLAAQRQAAEETGAHLAFLEQQMARRPKVAPWWWGLLLMTAALAAGTWLWHRGHWESGVWLGSLGFLAALAGYLLHRQEQRRRQAEAEEQAAGSRKQTGLAAEIAALEQEIAGISHTLAALAPEGGQPPPADLLEVEARQAAVDEALELWRDRQAQEDECRKAAEAQQAIHMRLQEAQEHTAQAARSLAELEESWRNWLTARHFNPTLRPESFEAVLQSVERARAAIAHALQARERCQRTQAYIREMQEKLTQVLERCQRRPKGETAGLADLAALRQDLAQALEEDRRKQDLAQQLEGINRHLAYLKGKLEENEAEQQALLTAAGARDDQEFLALAARHDEWRRWQKAWEEGDLALNTIAGHPQARQDLEAELAVSEPYALEAEEQELQKRLEEVENAIVADAKEVGGLKALLQQMAADRRLGDLLQEEANLTEQISRDTRQWLTLAAARRLLEEARRVYERERQPPVIQEADRFLREMAHGRYRLFAQVGGGGVRLEDRQARQKEEVHWSAGLADQVYLAVRLGLAREFGRRSEPLPVILDDILVKFDPRRRRGAARVILSCARDQQVLLFSSHPEIEALIRELVHEEDFRGVAVACFHLQGGGIAQVPV